jgi:hypothetical protein
MQLKITKPIHELQQDAIARVNSLAGDVITQSYPMHKQVNLAARYAAIEPSDPEAVFIKSMWLWIANIRNCSNEVCVQIRLATNMKTIRTIIDSYETTLASYPIPQ